MKTGVFWQRRFYDFNVYSRKKLREKLEYMHANPVVRKLVDHPKEWPWSSWSHYAKGEKGLIRIDGAEERTKEDEAAREDKEKSKSAPLKPKGAAPRVASTGNACAEGVKYMTPFPRRMN